MTETNPQYTTEHRKEFWDRLEDCRSGMLEVSGRFVPMTHNLEPEDGRIWFLTAKGTDMAAAAAANAESRYIVSNDSTALYVTVQGVLHRSDDREKLDEVWSAMAKLWFDEGRQDPDLELIYLQPGTAEVWLGPESGLKFFWSVVKSKLTEGEPDMGAHFQLKF
ncbi:pyridoxamine 5'-phosphate oxidase family protein [Falsigemmobacter faecalis]|uniref:General stress protein n=1 Tax=Falsigemmobacter faecalis TaxID=2488730 RepID=A0A3P3D343_9RHOB|nr:pyridoxamine 5'-phosphate oxidase family protein [Falsigemmobacter faecalis]RRH68839.1 general stress protein [Falsigemmobacter faecalis]